MSAQSFVCSAASRHAEEPLAASAPLIPVQFLLEYDAEWRAKATTDNDLPEPIQALMARTLEHIEESRWGFIKQPGRTQEGGRAFFVAVASADADDAPPRLYRFELEHVEDILDIDLPAVVAEDSAYEEHLETESLLLVCVNGKRDACCARYGVPAYNALSDADAGGERVWQATHIGGHRFAATGIALPAGIYLGRIDLADPQMLLAGIDSGHIPVAHYRGRSTWPGAAQAAEAHLAGEPGHVDLHTNRLRAIDDLGEGRLRVSMQTGSTHHSLTLDQSSEDLPVSCGSEATKAVARFTLVNHTQQPA